MREFRTWLAYDSRQADVVDKMPPLDGLLLSSQDDPSFRHWVARDGWSSVVLTGECSTEEEETFAKNHVRAKELLISSDSKEDTNNFLSLIHAGILLAYPDRTNFAPLSFTSEADGIDLAILRHEPFHKWFTFHDNVGYGCLVAYRAWSNPFVRNAIQKWRLSIDLDSFTPHSADPRRGQVFPTMYPDDTYHVKAAFAVNSAFSAIEELGLEVRSSRENPRFLGEKKDTWNPKVFENIKERLLRINVDPNEKFEWVVRGQERTIEGELKPLLGHPSPWANGRDIRDRTLTIVDAIHYASVIRNFISTHKFHSLIGELGPYDVFNIQLLTRRLILSSLSIWKKDFHQIANS